MQTHNKEFFIAWGYCLFATSIGAIIELAEQVAMVSQSIFFLLHK